MYPFQIPGFEGSLINTKYDWQFSTENNGVSSQGLINGSVVWPRGKMLGGSSSINGMIYVKGHDHDFQKWYDAGNEEWSVDEVRRCFRKAENLQNQEMLNNPKTSEYYGHDGYLFINKFNNTYKVPLEKVVDSWDEIGFKKVADLNRENFMASGFLPVTATNGLRQSSDRAYLMPVASRPNLKIIKNSFVTKILVNDNRQAYGVEVEKDGEKRKFYASKEVILSAGPINSPQLLMLSGIGPATHLKEHNIPCIVDSPMVGQNLRDHSFVPIFIHADGPEPPSKADAAYSVIDYLYNRKGTLAHGDMISNAVAFYSTESNATYPNSQARIGIIPKNTKTLKESFMATFGFNETIMDSIADLNKDYVTFFFTYHYLHHHSKGHISLRSNDPKDKPRIYLNYFEDARDLDGAVKGIRMATKIVNTKYLKSLNAFLGRINVPACNDLELDSEEYWKCISINIVTTVFHPVSTCKMGQNIHESVVSSRLKVHGVKNLRVIDSSVIPSTVSGDMNGSSNMVGERGAELVKEDLLKAH